MRDFSIFDTEPSSQKRSLISLGVAVVSVAILAMSFLYFDLSENLKEEFIKGKEVFIMTGAMCIPFVLSLFYAAVYQVKVAEMMLDRLILSTVIFSIFSSLMVSKIFMGNFEMAWLSCGVTVVFAVAALFFKLLNAMPLRSHYQIAKKHGWKTLFKINSNDKKNIVIDQVLADKNNKDLVLVTLSVNENVAAHFQIGNRMLTRSLNKIFNAYYVMAVKDRKLRIIFDKNFLIKNNVDKEVIQEHLATELGKKTLLKFFNAILNVDIECINNEKDFIEEFKLFIREQDVLNKISFVQKNEIVRKKVKI